MPLAAASSLLAALVLLTAQPEPAKTIPGEPGTDGKGGDHRVIPPGETPAPIPAAPAPPSPPAAPALAAAVPFPHPLITEVLFAVPSGPGGDANKDGTRDAAGDEFVELINPHDRPIQLFGYTLSDSQEPGKGQLKFTFPAIELAPGEIVVVFNGFGASIAAPVGDQRTPPTGPHAAFHNARVFSMRCPSNKTAFGNAGDHVMLTAPDGVNVQRVWWSEDPATRSAGRGNPPASAPAANSAADPTAAASPKPAPAPPLSDDYAPISPRSSVARDGILATSRFVSHMDLERSPFSPGTHTLPKRPEPAPKP